MTHQEKKIISGGGYHLPIVDYLKAVCIVLVIFAHTGLFNDSKPFSVLIVAMAVPTFMFLSGYVMGINSDEQSIAQLYRGNRMLRKLIRYTVPMLITYLLHEAIWAIGQGIIANGESFGWKNIQRFIYFDYGSGSYYFALIVEFLFLSPVLLWLLKRFNFHGVLLIGFLNFFYEISCSSYVVSYRIYRILIFRYLFVIALGMYIGVHKDIIIKNKYLISSFAIGLFYILLPSSFGYQYRLFKVSEWAMTSMIAAMYIFPIIYLVLYYGHDHATNSKIGSVYGIIGRASYHIMCTQMIYFCVRPYFYENILDVSKLGKAPMLLFDTAVSIMTGVVFYYVDNRFLTGPLIKRITQPQKT